MINKQNNTLPLKRNCDIVRNSRDSFSGFMNTPKMMCDFCLDGSTKNIKLFLLGSKEEMTVVIG